MTLFKYNLYKNTGSNPLNYQSPSSTDPKQNTLYFAQKFNDIFSSFLSGTDGQSDNTLGNSGSDSDLYGTSSDPFAANTNYQLAQMSMLQNNYFSSQNIDVLNKSVAIIGKTAHYNVNGKSNVGVIQSVLNDAGVLYFKINEAKIPLSDVSEVS